MKTPREHQIELFQNLQNSLRANKKVIACAATGFGKSLVIAMISIAALQKGKTVLVNTESDKIFRQLKEDIKGAIHIDSKSKIKRIAPTLAYVSMSQTLARRPHLIEYFNKLGENLIVLNDEAHIGTSTKLLMQLPNCLLIGFTATPDARWAKHLPELYRDIVIGKQPQWLIEKGFLTPYIHANKVPKGVDVSKSLTIGSTGDYTEESQERYFDAPDSINALVKDLKEIEYRKAMVFCASIKSANKVGEELTKAGIQNVLQHSKLSEEDAKKISLFENMNSGCNVCVSVGSMTKGYDFPPVDLVVLFRKTTSLPLYLQMLGRGSRKYDGKNRWICLDYGGNLKQHGFWNSEIDWHNRWDKVRKTDGVAPVKECPACYYMSPASAPKCPNCGNEFLKQDEEEKEIGELETVWITPFRGKRLSELTEQELATWAINAERKPLATRVAKAHEQKHQDGFLKRFGLAMGYKDGWAYVQCPKPTDPIISYHDIIVQ